MKLGQCNISSNLYDVAHSEPGCCEGLLKSGTFAYAVTSWCIPDTDNLFHKSNFRLLLEITCFSSAPQRIAQVGGHYLIFMYKFQKFGLELYMITQFIWQVKVKNIAVNLYNEFAWAQENFVIVVALVISILGIRSVVIVKRNCNYSQTWMGILLLKICTRAH